MSRSSSTTRMRFLGGMLVAPFCLNDNGDACAAGFTVGDADGPAVQLDDLAGDGEAQARAAAGTLGGEEWVPHLGELVGGDAAPGVLHRRDDDVVAFLERVG